MTPLNRHLRIFSLRALHATAGSGMTGDELKCALRSAFGRVAFTEAELDALLAGLKSDGLTDAATDPVLGVLWTLTVKGLATAERLAPEARSQESEVRSQKSEDRS